MSHILPLIKRIAQNAREKSGEGRLGKFFLFKMARKGFAIPAVDVEEVAMPGSLLQVPQSSQFLKGVVNIRGIVIPVINLRARFGLNADYEIKDESRLLLFTLKSSVQAGIIADEIEYRLHEGIIEPTGIDEADGKSFRTAVIGGTAYPVLMIEGWLEKNEIEILQTVVESF